MYYEVLRMEHISRFVNGRIINSISMNLFRGETLCVITEDIDTKLFLLDLLQGENVAYQGHFFVHDKRTALQSPQHARKLGIYFATEKQLVLSMNVAHNLYMTDDAFYSPITVLDNRSLYLAAENLLHEFSLDYIKPRTTVSSLSPVDIYLLSILQAYASGAKIIVLDNPYYNLYRPDDVKKFQHLVTILKKNGISILWFTSKWDIIFQNFDRFAVIQDGVVTQLAPLTTIPPVIPTQELLRSRFKVQENTPRRKVLECIDFPYYVHGSRHFLNFSLFEGEILGLCDINNSLSGTINLLETEKSARSGAFLLDGRPFRPDFHVKEQIAFISGNAGHARIFPQMNLFDNVALLLNKPMYSTFGFMNKRIRNHIAGSVLESIHAEYLLKEYGNKKNLKGMKPQDQFMVEVAKWLCLQPKVFIFINPHNIYDNLSEYNFRELLDLLHDLGISILIISISEESLSKLCTRIETVD